MRKVRGFPTLFVFVLLAGGSGRAQEPLVPTHETNLKIQQLAAGIQARPVDYVIGGGDLLVIDVFDVHDLSREVRVSDSGYISLPLIPVKIRAGGLTPFQLEQKLAELLQVNGLVSNPQVTVFVKEHRSQPITVIGAVKSPMVFQVIRQTTLLEVLSAAGGLADDAGGAVLISRAAPSADSTDAVPAGGDGQSAGPQTLTVQIKDLLSSGDPKFNIFVFGGDVITVPRAGIVYVVGAVERPGGFALQSEGEEMTILTALALAQGLTGTAKNDKAVIIRKNPKTGQRQEIAVNLNKVMSRRAEDIRLQANDILFVPDSTGKKALRRVADTAIGVTTGIIVFRGGR